MAFRYSPIGPIKILQKLQQKDALGNYLLVLAHDVLANEADYVFLLDELTPGTQQDLVIMDNGVIELGKALPFEQIVEAADIVQADCIVMPDVLGDFHGTRHAIKAEYGQIMDCDYPIMKVPQGEDPSAIVQCIDWLADAVPLKDGQLDYWGVPRWITNKIGSRKPIIEYINRTIHSPQIHLLGMSKNITDDVVCSHMDNVMGIDSANPIVFGLADRFMGINKYRHLDRGDYWKKTDVNYNVLRNIEYVRNVLFA